MIFLKSLMAIGVGGAIGAMARYSLSYGISRWLGSGFPVGTLVVNIIGCFLMGLLAESLAARFAWPVAAQLFATTGLLGGFTTFSAYSLEAVLLFEREAYAAALFYVVASVVLSIGALVAGLMLARSVLAAG